MQDWRAIVSPLLRRHSPSGRRRGRAWAAYVSSPKRTMDNALDHIHLIQVREQINERLRGVTREIQELNKIGAALSAEHHLDNLLELILTKSRHITNADAGSLYLVEAKPASEEKQEI